jgi:hypothetical protein
MSEHHSKNAIGPTHPLCFSETPCELRCEVLFGFVCVARVSMPQRSGFVALGR